ncbi:acetyltransferase [Sphingomonas sp.]|uniref:acetyltransferase n=1 Tax=Sphingomonas sp. TaxID=28214 RepID=UPI0035C7E044
MDEFDDAFRRLDQTRALTALTIDRPAPDAAGRANAIARQTGVPAETADRNLPSLEQQVQIARARRAMEREPTVAAWASNPRHAAVGADDMDALAKNAAYWRRVSDGQSLRSQEAPDGTLWNSVTGIGTSLYEGVRTAGAQIRGVLDDWLPGISAPSAPGTPTLGNYGAINDRRLRAQSAARVDAATPQFKSKFASGLYGGVSSLAQTAPSILVGMATGSPAAGLAVAGLQQGVPAYNKYRDRGGTRGQALAGGALEGGIEVATEKLPMEFLVKRLGKLGAGDFLSGFLGRELPGELVATVTQNAVDTAIANPDKTWGEYLAEQPDALVQTAIGTLVAGGFFSGVNAAANRYGGRAVEGARAAEAGDALNAAMDGAAQSKVRIRDPEAFKQFVAAHTDGSAIENVFIPAEKVASYFQSQDIDHRDDEFWGGYADQIDEALATGGDVVIPTADAAAYLAGTPAWDALKGDARTSPGGMSLAEAQSLEGSRAEAMEQMGAQVAEQMAQQQGADAPRQRIYQDIRDKLTNAGYLQDAAHLNAELVAARYATRAERLGLGLVGDETSQIEVNSVLPANLAPIVAKDAGDVALQSVINVMRRGLGAKSDRQLFGDSLVEWIAKNGGIEDKGGDLASMGAADWHRGKPGRRKLIRPHADAGQGSMLGGTGQQNANTPDELAYRAMEAGYFPAGARPDIGDLMAAIDAELRGSPVYAQYAGGLTEGDHSRAAADELSQILEQRGVDPATATDAEIKETLNQFRQEQAEGYQQTFGSGPRGQISFQADGRSVIDLFQSRNLSTFVHEMGHQWLEELRQDASNPDAPDSLKADWQAVQDWFTDNGHSLADGAIPVDAHELWARGVERFVMEGKSPSSLLRRVFDAFRGWMLNIYQVVENLRAPITPEIRDVMQRLVATDAEIADARERESLSALFTDAAQAGMTEAEFAAYSQVASDARNEAHDALLYRTMETIRRQRTKAWKDEEAGVRSDITARVAARPEFRALHLLRTGRMLDDLDAPALKVRLDKQWLIDTYGEGVLASLPKSVPPIYAETNTTAADDIAEMVGFPTGDQMIRTLITMQERTATLRAAGDKRSLRQALIDEETAAEMRDRHGDPLNDGSIEQEALAAVHNERQGEVIAAELRSLGRRAGNQPTPYQLAKDWARTKIAESTVQDAASGSAMQRYARAAAKAGKAAEAAMLKGDIDEAYRQKQAQMLNNALIAEAGRMRDAVASARDRLASYARRRTIKSMDQDYLEHIHDLLEQVEFKPRTQKSLDRQQSFAEWAAAREAEGHDVVVPASFGQSLGTTHWSRLTVEKLLGLDDTVQQIAHLGRLKQRLIDGAEERAHEEVVGEALAGIEALPQREPVKFDPTWTDRIKAGIEGADAGLLKMETIVDWLDGGNSNGVFNRMAFRPIAEAQAREQDMTADYFARVRQAMEAVPKVERWMERVTVPELYDRETGEQLTVTRQRLVAMALNMGNEGNIQRLTDGYGWNRDAVMTVLNRELTSDDWRFVQTIWDTIDTLWPQIAAMERRVNGVEPDKVEAVSVETSAGTLRGGYYPAIYDTARDLRAERNAGAGADLLDAAYTRATTRASATKDRMEKVKRPILLDVGVINRHLGEVIHDITHREAIINAHQFLFDSRVQKAINDTLGPAIRKQMRPWLKHVANQWAAERAGNEGIGRFMGKLRANTTAVGMGFRLSTIITQAAGYANSQEVIGGKWMAQAIAQAGQHPIDSFRFVMERSGEVRHRMDTLDRDIGALMRSLDVNPLEKGLGATRDAMRFMYHGIGYADRVVVVPTWIAAYNKALAGGAEEGDAIYEADKAVRQSQGSGGAKDLAAIQRGTGTWGEALKLSTMFYSYFSALYQRQRNLGRDALGSSGKPRDMPALLSRALWLVVIPPVLSQLLVGKGPGDDEDWGVWSFKQMLFNALAPIPFVRDLVQPLWDKAAGNKSFGYQLSPVQRAGETMVNVAGDTGRIARGEDTKRATRDALEATGYATGLVPGQLATATQFLVDVGYGEQDPEGVMEWYRGLTTGKTEPRK